MAGGISLHAVDVVGGRAAEGMAVRIERLAPTQALVAEGRLTAAGTLDHLVVQGAGVVAGTYEATFAVRPFYEGQGVASPFLGELTFRFDIADAAEHFHLPLKFSPWGLALFRGA